MYSPFPFSGLKYRKFQIYTTVYMCIRMDSQDGVVMGVVSALYGPQVHMWGAFTFLSISSHVCPVVGVGGRACTLIGCMWLC